ncbi:MAG: hypothetical protein CMJ76_07890 [Planctomycetaceae bacterium]|nr:hypothetical protein [Planctomycetaceae bacterium]
MNDYPPHNHSLTRRDALAQFGSGLGAIGLLDLLRRDSAAQDNSDAPLPATAKHVIWLFMQGGPSHLETFDPKPELSKQSGKLLPEEFRKFDLAQINTADATVLGGQFEFKQHGQSGVPISTLFPHLATQADKLAVIRSCYHELFIHGSALTMMHSGTRLLGHPSVGSWITYGIGSETEELPSYIAMTNSFFRNGTATFSSGFLPAMYQGTFLRTSGMPIQNLNRPGGLSAESQQTLLKQIQLWNKRHRDNRPGDSRLDARIANYELAYKMQVAAPEVIDLSKETRETEDLYGIHEGTTQTFGKMCLMARRMVERGVRYIHLVDGDWDAHGGIQGNHSGRAQAVDKPIAGLLKDLEARGLLDETLVVWSGEFGRTPIMQGNQGRDHHPYGFSIWMAGGGIQGGQVIGATDDFGFNAIEDRFHVNDLHATILSLLGIEHTELTYLFEGRDRRLTDVGGLNDLSHRLTRS